LVATIVRDREVCSTSVNVQAVHFFDVGLYLR